MATAEQRRLLAGWQALYGAGKCEDTLGRCGRERQTDRQRLCAPGPIRPTRARAINRRAATNLDMTSRILSLQQLMIDFSTTPTDLFSVIPASLPARPDVTLSALIPASSMRQWPAPLRTLRPSTCCGRRFVGPVSRSTLCSPRRRLNTEATYSKAAESSSTGLGHSFNVFNRISPPLKSSTAHPDEWITLLEPALPPHLRRTSDQTSPTVPLDGVDVAEILLAAQNLKSTGIGQDLLQHLGNVQQRWSAVVFLIKLIIDTFDQDFRTPELTPSWTRAGEYSLSKLTESPVYHASNLPLRHNDEQPISDRSPEYSSSYSLDAFTRNIPRGDTSLREALRRDALGQVWCSLGNMIMTCVDTGGVVQPEILEMIAYLHHHGWMPDSIYHYKPHADPTALQQPPILHLCSSRIFTSLSDAAWRGHERTLTEHTQTRPEMAAKAYRVNVAGLRPEVWLELILWASLHGGWIAEGVHVMRLLIAEKRGWQPLSWRSIVSSGEARAIKWQEIDHIFNTRTPDKDTQPAYNVHKTISSEVVNAYVDALITMSASDSARDVANTSRLLTQLQVLRRFLDRSSSLVNGGTWDAAIVRLLDHSGDKMLSSTHLMPKLLSLSSQFGGELQSAEASILPSYVFDGSAAMLGACHHALRAQVAAGNLAGALIILETLQSYTDTNKRISVNLFFQSISMKQQLAQEKAPHQMFDSSYGGITFPAFDPQIPPAILGGLFNLVTVSKAFDIGKWLLYSDTVDGPLISAHLYHDPVLSPALIRFAVESGDSTLLSACIPNKNKRRSLTTKESVHFLRAYMDSQISLQRWDAVKTSLSAMKDSAETEWTVQSLALLTAAMIKARFSDTSENLNRTKRLFAKLVAGGYDIRRGQHDTPTVRLLVLILSSLDPYWSQFCFSISGVNLKSYIQFPPVTHHFNVIFEAVVSCHGIVVGKRLLDTFWPQDVRTAQLRKRQHQTGTIPVLEGEEHQRSIVQPQDPSANPVVILGGLSPNIRTFVILLGQAIREMKDAPLESSTSELTVNGDDSLGHGDKAVFSPVDETSPREILWWAVQTLLNLGMSEAELRYELASRMEEARFAEIEDQLSTVVRESTGTTVAGNEVPLHGEDVHSNAVL